MKTTKKALSVLLAVIMIMSSMSVCFGSISFAADDTGKVDAFVAAMQCDAMKSFSVTRTAKSDTSQTFTYTAPSYTYYEQVVNVITKLDAAIKGLDEYTNGANHNNNSDCSDGWKDGASYNRNKCTDLGWIEKHLKLAIGDSRLATLNGTYNLGALFGAVFNVENCDGYRNADGKDDMTESSSKNSVNAAIHNILIVKTTTVAGKLTSYSSISDIPDTLPSEYQYKLSMCRQNWTSGKWYNKQNHYHYAINTNNNDGKINVPAATGATIATNKSVLVTAQSTFNSYSNYLNAADVNAVLAISTDATTLTKAYDAINTQRNNVVNNFDQATLTKFFPKVDTALKNISDAIDFLAFESLSNAIKALYGVDFSRMNESETLAHLTAFRTKWAEFTKLEQATQDLVASTYNIDVDAIEERIQEISDRYDSFRIRNLKATIDTHINMYEYLDIDDVDNAADPAAIKSTIFTAIATLYNDLNSLNSYDAALVAEVCGAGYKASVQTRYDELSALGVAANLNYEYLAKYMAFVNDIQPATADGVDNATVRDTLKNYDAWTVELKNLINSMKDTLGAEDAQKLYDEVDGVMKDYMDAAYVALNARVEAEIETAWGLYQGFKANHKLTGIDFTNISAYNQLKTSIGLIDTDAYEFLKVSQNIRISQDAINKYNELVNFAVPGYQEFLDSFGFSNYNQTKIPDLVREESTDDIAREGTYTTKDADIEKIITKLDALLNNAEVQKLLGQLLNKNEDGTWNGKSFDLGAMLTDLIKGALFTDNMINTIVGMLYPLVVTEFIKVWANDLPDKNGDYDISYIKDLYTIFKEAKFDVYPDLLAASLKNVNATKYANNISILNAATTNFKKANSNQYYTLKWSDADGKNVADKTPWDEAVLKKNVIDEETGEPVLNEDGTNKTEWALDWGVDAKREELEAGTITQAQFDDYFYQTFDDAVDGLKPLLLALLGNKAWAPSEVDHIADTKHKVIITLSVEVGLQLGATANRGYANLIIPVYEALGITNFKTASQLEALSSNTNPAADILKGILDPIFNFANTTLKNAPLTTILNLLPNLAYALITDMVPELLDMLKTSITYKAIPYIIGGNIDVSSFVDISGGADISVGSMLNLKDMGVDLSDGLNTLLPGFGLNIPNIDQGKLATMGTLGQINTGRAEAIYTQPAAGKAYHINANKADVLLFLLDYALSSGLLGQFITVPEEEGLVRDLLTNLMNPENTDNVLAALVELLNAKAYNTLENYEWYHGYIDNVEVGTITDPAVQIYLNPENDWTEDKAQYLYDNIDAIVGAILKMANVDLDDTTEEVDGSIGKLIGGIFSAKTLTSIARLLGSISDINALIEGIGAETEETETPDASEPETVEEGEDANEGEEDENAAEAAPAIDIDVNALIKEFLGVDLKTAFGMYADIPTVEENPDYIYDFGKEIKTASDFAAVLSEMLAPLNPVLGFILDGKNLTLTIKEAVKDETGAVVTPAETVELIGYNGYDSAIVPLLEALGCDAKAYEDGKALELTLTALATKIDALTSGKTIKGIIDILPGLFYFLAGNNLSTVVRNLLQPVYVILDTIRPIINVDIAELIAGIEIGEEGNKQSLGLDLDVLNLNFVFDLIKKFIPAEINLGTLLDDVKELIYSICKIVGKEYTSVSALAGQTTWKRGEYGEFSQADLITVLLSFILEWASDAENAATLDELLGTDGIIASLNTVFASVEITYGTPDWMYWFANEAAFNAYLEEPSRINTLASIDWENIGDNEWDYNTAAYFAENIEELVDLIIAMINKDKFDEEGNALPTNLKALINNLLNGLVTADTMNDLIGMIAGLLGDIDDNLLNLAGYLLSDGEGDKIDIVGLKAYTCDKEFATLSDFINELANVLDTYASGLIDWLFFGDDFRFAKKSDKTDTIVINGGLGYEKGLAIILEALGCELPEEANTKSVLGALATRVDAILADPIDEVLELLPNLVYALNANAVGVALNNLLGPVNALLDKINGMGLLENPISLADLLTIKIYEKDENGEIVKDEEGNDKVEKEVAIDLANLSLANVVEIVEKATDLPLDAAEAILVNFCTGKITKGQYGYKMAAAREDVITILLVVALELISDEDFAEKLDEMLGTDGIVAGIKEIINGAEPTYATPDWNYMKGKENAGVIEYVNAITSYPNDWTEAKAEYLAANLPALVDTVIGMIEINGVKYESLSALLKANVNVFTTETLNSLLDMIKNLLGGIDDGLLEVGFILDVDLVGLKNYTVEKEITTVEEFALELANVLNTYAKGAVEWLLLGRDFKLIVKDADGAGKELEQAGAYITVNGAQGYAEGLALLLEALGCKNLPEVYDENGEVKALDTADTVTAVLKSLAARINEILEMPVERVLEILPNLIYFLDANGVAVVIENTLAALNGIVNKLEVFGIELDIMSLVDLPKLMGIADKYEDGEAKIGLDNLTLVALLRAVSLMTGLDLTELQNVLVPFALGKAVKYDSVSASDAYKMVYRTDKEGNKYDKHDMLSVIVTAALKVVVENKDNAAKLDEMLSTNIVSALKDVFASVEITYATPDWNYMEGIQKDNVIEYVNAIVSYPNDWTEAKAEYLVKNLPALVDTVIGMLEINGVKYESLSALLNTLLADANVFSTKNLQAIVDLIAGLLKDIDDGLLKAAGVLLGVDVVGLKAYKAPEGVDTVEEFAIELANVLNKYAKGVVEWLLLGKDYTFFVKKVDENGLPVDFITLNGAQGYAEGLALLLEALGCENLPAADGKTEDIVTGVLTSLAARIDEILANPVEEVLDLLPNLIYFLDANGVAVVIENTLAALNGIVDKLSVFGIELDITSLVNLPKLMGIEDKYAEGEEKIGLDNLTLVALLKAVSLMTGLDLTDLQNVLVPFALGEAQKYDSVSASDAYKMVYKTDLDKHDMLSVIVTAALKVVVENEDNAAKLDEMLGTDIVSALKDVFASVEILYTAPNWNYPLGNNGTVDAMKYSITYPNNWTEATAEEVTKFLLSDDFDTLITGLIDKNYATLSDLLKAKVNVFTTDNLQAIVDLIANLLKDIDEGLLEAAGVLLGADVVGLKAYKAPAGITTVDAFAAELANVLNTYAKGVVEWLLLGNDYTFFVKEVKNGVPVDFITINGAHGYAEGLALLLEALGCEELPTVYDVENLDTEATVKAVLESLANRINEIFADPVNEIVDLLPNLFYFLNTNGVAAVVDNTTAALTALLEKLEAFGLELDLNELVNLKKLMKIEDTDATISLDNLSMADLLQAVSYMIKDLDITHIKEILVGFALGKVEAYTSVSKEVGETKKMVYATEFDKYDMVTVVANILLITIADEDNAAFVKNLVGDDIYAVIIDILNLSTNEVPVKYMDWQGVPDKVGQIFNALETSPTYKGFEYGPLYTEEMAQYIADNIGEFVNNIIYLLGLEINGVNVESLEDLLNNLVGGSLYNSDLVITIRDALAGLAGSIEGLEVEGKNVGKLIVKVLAAAEIADLKAIGKVAVPEFEDNREMFVESLCNVLEPAYGLLTWLLADEDLAFFVDLEKNNFITLPGADGYRNGIALLLEAIGCEPTALAKGVEGEALVKAILNPLLNRLDVIFANPAEEILAVLTNVIYFINSNGIDVVIKNTLNAVYTVLAAIEPIAKVDLYKLVGLDAYVTLSAEELIDMLLSKLEVAGFDFTAVSVDLFSELTIGKLTQYTSISAEGAEAYKMVYDAQYADEADMVTAVMRLVITFILTDNNREVLVDLLKDVLGMSADAEKYVRALLKAFADNVVGKKGEDLRLGMDSVLATIYYIFYGLDTGVDNTVAGKKDLDKLWAAKIKELNDNSPSENTQVGDLITDIFDIIFNDEGKIPEGGGNDVADKEEIAPNGFIAFFQRIAKFFEEIGEFFRNLFSFGK